MMKGMPEHPGQAPRAMWWHLSNETWQPWQLLGPTLSQNTSHVTSIKSRAESRACGEHLQHHQTTQPVWCLQTARVLPASSAMSSGRPPGRPKLGKRLQTFAASTGGMSRLLTPASAHENEPRLAITCETCRRHRLPPPPLAAAACRRRRPHPLSSCPCRQCMVAVAGQSAARGGLSAERGSCAIPV